MDKKVTKVLKSREEVIPIKKFRKLNHILNPKKFKDDRLIYSFIIYIYFWFFFINRTFQ